MFYRMVYAGFMFVGFADEADPDYKTRLLSIFEYRVAVFEPWKNIDLVLGVGYLWIIPKGALGAGTLNKIFGGKLEQTGIDICSERTIETIKSRSRKCR